MNYVELHLGDWAQAVAHLSLVEEAVYLRLLRRYYADEKPLPSDLAACQRLAGARTQDEREAVAVVLSEFFDLSDEGHRNKRADEEIAKVHAKKGKASASAKARWDAVASVSDADALRTHSEGNALQSPDTIKDQERMSANADAQPADRLTQVADQALDAYNHFATAHALPIARRVAMEKKRAWVKRSLRVIREVCAEAYGSPLIPPEFWPQFFDACGADPFLRGEAKSRDHPNWKPDFEYLTRPDVIAKVYERNAND